MKNIRSLVITSAALILYSSAVYAESAKGTITDHYRTVINKSPYTVEVCQDVVVSGDKTGDALKGAIIGGIIGNNVGNIENGGAAGAIIGGLLGHNNSKATGGVQRQCTMETRYKEESQQVYSHSIISFNSNGKNYTIRFKR